MAVKIIVAICTFAFINAVNSQVIRGYPPALVDFLPNQVYYNPTIFPTPNLFNCDLPFGYDPIITTPVTVPATTTIIQDSTVANNLANALQLLVVSNLLSNTLPYMGADIVVPGCGCGVPSCGCGVPSCGCGVPGCGCGAPFALPAGYSYVY